MRWAPYPSVFIDYLESYLVSSLSLPRNTVKMETIRLGEFSKTSANLQAILLIIFARISFSIQNLIAFDVLTLLIVLV